MIKLVDAISLIKVLICLLPRFVYFTLITRFGGNVFIPLVSNGERYLILIRLGLITLVILSNC